MLHLKNTVPLITMIAMIISSCGNQNEQQKAEPKAAQKTMAEQALPNEHLLTTAEAVELIRNYLLFISEQGNAAELKQLPIGGAISAESMDRMTADNEEANGYMFYGFKDMEPATLFSRVPMLAACKFNYQPDDPSNYHASDLTNVYLINDTVKNPYTSLSPEAVTNYLTNYRKIIPAAASVYTYNKIKSNANDYTAFFNQVFGAQTIEYPYALFSADEFMNRLYDFTGGKSEFSGIRYFFGYDNNAATNKIRIVIFGVNKEGANIVADHKILERHWPPA